MRRPGIATLALALGMVLAACTAGAAPAASPAASGPATVEITPRTVGELQAVLRTQRDAISKRDQKAYSATFDQQRGAFRRCKQESFDIAGRAGISSVAPRIVKAEPYGGIYARAWVDEGSNGLRRTYFRQLDGKWIQSEPTDSEIGPQRSTMVDGIDIEYWAVDDDVVDALTTGTRAARDTVLRNLISDVRKPFGVRFYPTRSAAGIVGCSVAGYHIPNAAADDKFLRLIQYWFTPDQKALSPAAISILQHEGLHWAQDQFSPGISARLDWWLVEGWPDFVGQSRSTEVKKTVLCGTGAPTFKQLVDGPPDLPETPPEEPARYYAFANTMVEYLSAQFGPDAYKQLLTVYKDGVDPKVNYPKVLKVTPDEFYAGWLAFAKKKFC